MKKSISIGPDATGTRVNYTTEGEVETFFHILGNTPIRLSPDDALLLANNIQVAAESATYGGKCRVCKKRDIELYTYNKEHIICGLCAPCKCLNEKNISQEISKKP